MSHVTCATQSKLLLTLSSLTDLEILKKPNDRKFGTSKLLNQSDRYAQRVCHRDGSLRILIKNWQTGAPAVCTVRNVSGLIQLFERLFWKAPNRHCLCEVNIGLHIVERHCAVHTRIHKLNSSRNYDDEAFGKFSLRTWTPYSYTVYEPPTFD